MSGSAGDLSDRSVPELLELFASISQEIETVDHVGRVNRLHDTRRRVVAAIKDRSDGTVRALLPLVSHDDPHVRWGAAFYYDEIEPNTCVRVLRELASRKDAIGRKAASSLEWAEKLSITPSSETTQDAPAPRAPSPRASRLCRHDAPAGMSRAELESLLFDAFPRETATTLMALARPAIRVWPQPLARASDTGSRFGGLPIVPKNWQWPTTEVWPKSAGLAFLNMSREERSPMPQEPNWFLGQINCADLQGLAARDLLPNAGIFSFFGDSDLVTGCTGSWDYGGLYFFSGDDLVRAAEPIEDFETLPICGLAFSDAIDLPDPSSSVIKNLALDKLLSDQYFEIRQRVSHYGVNAERYDTLDCSKLFGWPDLIQRDLEAFEDEKDADGRLLLQIGSYDNSVESWSWGPGGLVYFALSSAAFNEGDCGACRYEMQCT
jgi:uncharacterized protein YwqG